MKSFKLTRLLKFKEFYNLVRETDQQKRFEILFKKKFKKVSKVFYSNQQIVNEQILVDIEVEYEPEEKFICPNCGFVSDNTSNYCKICGELIDELCVLCGVFI